MRDTLIGLFLIVGLGMGYWLISRSSDAITPLESTLGNSGTSKSSRYTKQGVHNERKNSKQIGRDQKFAKNTNHQTGSAAADLESEGVHSIYSQGPRKSRSSVKPSSQFTALPDGIVDADAPLNKSETAKVSKSPVIHGLPVDDWILSRRDSISLQKVSPPAPSQLRFFFQCMELKEGVTNELKEGECRALAAKNTPRPAGFIR